jgi:peptide subunit release factor 1 (eRF1)
MAGKIGVWIDHRKAILVRFHDGVEVVREIDSEAEKHVRDAGGSGSGCSHGSQDVVAGDKRDRKFMNHLNTFYDHVIQQFEHSEGIVILGPGEAKGELDKRIISKEMRKHILLIETADKMTTPQLIAKMRACFELANHVA